MILQFQTKTNPIGGKNEAHPIIFLFFVQCGDQVPDGKADDGPGDDICRIVFAGFNPGISGHGRNRHARTPEELRPDRIPMDIGDHLRQESGGSEGGRGVPREEREIRIVAAHSVSVLDAQVCVVDIGAFPAHRRFGQIGDASQKERSL